MRYGARGCQAPHVDDALLRVRQVRGAMVGCAQLASPCRAADGLTSTSPLPMAVINISRPVEPWSWRDLFLAPVELLALAWGVPLLVLLALLPVGLVIAGAVRLGRMIFGS